VIPHRRGGHAPEKRRRFSVAGDRKSVV
jgi:hypothetical protein